MDDSLKFSQVNLDLYEILKVSPSLLGAWLSLKDLQEDKDMSFLKTDWCCISSTLLSSLHHVYQLMNRLL